MTEQEFEYRDTRQGADRRSRLSMIAVDHFLRGEDYMVKNMASSRMLEDGVWLLQNRGILIAALDERNMFLGVSAISGPAGIPHGDTEALRTALFRCLGINGMDHGSAWSAPPMLLPAWRAWRSRQP